MLIDRKPRELLKQYSRISIVDGTSFQANPNRQQSVKKFNSTGSSLQRGLSKKEFINVLNKEHIDDKQGKGMISIVLFETFLLIKLDYYDFYV